MRISPARLPRDPVAIAIALFDFERRAFGDPGAAVSAMIAGDNTGENAVKKRLNRH